MGELTNQIKKALRSFRIGQIILIRRAFKLHHGYMLNIKNPKTFSEKIQWMKLYGNIEVLSGYIDKFEVRKYVEETIGSKYLVPIIGIYEDVDKIIFESLPTSFVIKATHASGWNLIVEDKQKIDWGTEKRKISNWINSNFYDLTGEPNYKLIKGRVVIEKFLEDPLGDLKDYKFFCFDGHPKYVQVDSKRFKGHKRDLYDLNWNKLEVKYLYDNSDVTIEKPENFDEMISLVKLLSKGFNFVRVDLYSLNNEIFFGELTFTPESGFGKFSNIDYDFDLGRDFRLERYRSY